MCRCALLKAILKMCLYANVSLMLELFAHSEGDAKTASVLATQLCEVISLVMLNDVSLMDHMRTSSCVIMSCRTPSLHI